MCCRGVVHSLSLLRCVLIGWAENVRIDKSEEALSREAPAGGGVSKKEDLLM